ncbi:YceI family protein [Flammeovirgaceae bacterium SG7u.111]|nr:YceI family protein [Flammeovirgaceae bacterium SG7u.132]WPO38593.1 YceI family protein [Flammeovirgaceae bacterium SG7u.111]
MKKYILILLLLTGSLTVNAQEKMKLANSEVSFFSSAPMEDIAAMNKATSGIIDFETKKFVMAVPIKDFEFDKSLMQEHFNENYMESDKYPKGVLKGSFTGDVDLGKDGEYKLEAMGELDIHGKTMERTIPVTLTVKDGKATIYSEFTVKLEDHKIKIPKVVFMNIAEEIEVKIKSELVEI